MDEELTERQEQILSVMKQGEQVHIYTLVWRLNIYHRWQVDYYDPFAAQGELEVDLNRLIQLGFIETTGRNMYLLNLSEHNQSSLE